MDSTRRNTLEAAGAISEASRRDGSVWVKTTSQGLPLEVNIDALWAQRGGPALAAEIVALCKLAHIRAGVQQRQSLVDAGVPRDALAQMGLPTAKDLAAAEAAIDENDDEVGSWLERA